MTRNKKDLELNQLETTIVDAARIQLAELRQALIQPVGAERNDDVSSAYWMLTGLVMLAHIVGNGLSEDATQELLTIEREAGQAMTAVRSQGEQSCPQPSRKNACVHNDWTKADSR